MFTPPSELTLTATATDLAAIQTVVNNIATQQVPLSAQFDDDGYALLFEPGTYGSASDPLVFQVGYYTEVAGLGAVPQDTIINGQIEVFSQRLGLRHSRPNCWGNSDVNFWRSMSNLTLNVMDATKQLRPEPSPNCRPSVRLRRHCFRRHTDLWSVRKPRRSAA